MDWQHLIMNGENLAEYAELLAMEGLLGHQHANSGWGVDRRRQYRRRHSFHGNSRAGSLDPQSRLRRQRRADRFRPYPYTEDPIAAARQSLIQWCFIDDLCSKLDDDALNEAQQQKDALAAYRLVFETLGLIQPR